MDLTDLDATATAAEIAAGRVRSREIVEAALARIERLDFQFPEFAVWALNRKAF